MVESSQKYFCECCDYETSKIFNYNKHLMTAKHKRATTSRNLEITGNKKVVENSFDNHCSICNYSTTSNSDFNKHLTTEKHKKNIIGESKEIKHICSQCSKEYMNYSGLWKHKKLCSTTIKTQTEQIQNTFSDTNLITIQNFTPEMFMEVLRQSKELQDVLFEQNRELQHKLLEKETELQNKLLEQNAEHHKQIIELAKNQSITNNNNNFYSNNTQ